MKHNILSTTETQLSLGQKTASVSEPRTAVHNKEEMTFPGWNQRGILGMQDLIILLRIRPGGKPLFS